MINQQSGQSKYANQYFIYISYYNPMIEDSNEKYLIRLKDCVQQQKFQLIHQKISKFTKYFFDIRSRTFMLYDHTSIYFLSEEQTKIIDLGKQHPIVQLSYNPTKNILVFLNHDGHLLAHFIHHKTQLTIRKDVKKESIFSWVYNRENLDLFIAQPNGIKFMKVDEQKKTFKQIKSISNKYNSFLYQPNSQSLICFPTGDCRFVSSFLFDDQLRAKNWFKGPEININIENDQNLKAMARKNKSLGLHSTMINYELFHKQEHEQFAAETIEMNNKCYIVFYFGSEGKLKLHQVSQQPQKQAVIKLPSDCLPSFVVIDNMLVIHLKNQKITFIYDINGPSAQMLVSPFPVEHASRQINPYQGVFVGKRHIMPDGTISKWTMNITAIFNYLKNQQQIFDFLVKRQKAKGDLLKWLRQNLLRVKNINLSKFWKIIFLKMQSNIYKQRDIITLTELYANIFYTLYNDELTPKQPLLNIVIECIRQARQMQIKIPTELQKLLFDLLLDCKKYETLVFLCHSDIIKDSQQLVESLMRKAAKQNQQILLTLAVDMANRVCKPQKVFEMLVLSQNIWLARRYLKQNYENIQVLFMLYSCKGIRDLKIRQQFLKLIRSFILRKFPSISQKYLNEAEQQMKGGLSPNKIMSNSQKIEHHPQPMSPKSPVMFQTRQEQEQQRPEAP